MASAKQIEANRRNARNSTGPKTAAGKDRTRLNALKHGITARTVVLPGEDAEVLQARVDAWKDDVQPRGALEDYLVERAAHVAWQLDRADRTIAARLADAVRHGQVDQANRQADEVAALGRQLFWDPVGPICVYPQLSEGLEDPKRVSWPKTVDDPLDPARIVNRLEATAVGCRWLLDRWSDLRGILEDGLKWQPPDRLRAVRLLGKQPLDAADDERVMAIYLAYWAMETDGPHGFLDVATELNAGERKRFNERIDGRETKARMPADPEAGKAALLELVARAATRLEALLSVHEQRQALESPGRLDALAFDDSDSGERLRRYQLACERTLIRTINTALKVRAALSDAAIAAAGPEAPGAVPTDPRADSPALETPLIPLAGDPAAAPIELREQVATVEPPVDQHDETNPIPDGDPRAISPDPCSEGLRFEAGIGAEVSTLPGPSSVRRGRASGGRRTSARPIPPLILEALRALAQQQRTSPAMPSGGATPAALAAPPAS
jgi:hypothetical protein